MHREVIMNGFLTRRRFVQGGAGLILAAGAARTATAQTATPVRGGHIRVAVDNSNLNDSLDPALASSSFVLYLNYLTRNWLVEKDAKGNVLPSLAESFEPSKDAATWTFKLRRGVEFHNGKSLTATDVRASILHHLGEDSKSAAKSLFSDLESIDISDDLTLQIVLKSGNVDLPALLCDYHMLIVPTDADGKVDALSGIGTGPYKLARFDPGVVSEHERFENHWRDDRGYFDGCTLIGMNDVNARISALMTGEVDAIARVDGQLASRLESRQDIRVLEALSGYHSSFAMWTDTAPFDNNDVRLALKYSIDREALMSAVLMGHGSIGNDHPLNQAYREWPADIEQRPYDPDKAKFHLNRAGLSKLTVDLNVSDAGNAGNVDAAVLWQQHAGPAGITINVVRQPEDGYWSNVWLKKPFVAGGWGERPSSSVLMATVYASNVPWNDTHLKNERFDQLLLQAKVELDESKRRELFREMCLLIRNEGGAVIPFFNNRLAGCKANVVINEDMPANFFTPGSVLTIDRWWFAA
jgi:peptide/nickel transport system substrate-binding protein